MSAEWGPQGADGRAGSVPGWQSTSTDGCWHSPLPTGRRYAPCLSVSDVAVHPRNKCAPVRHAAVVSATAGDVTEARTAPVSW